MTSTEWVCNNLGKGWPAGTEDVQSVAFPHFFVFS